MILFLGNHIHAVGDEDASQEGHVGYSSVYAKWGHLKVREFLILSLENISK